MSAVRTPGLTSVRRGGRAAASLERLRLRELSAGGASLAERPEPRRRGLIPSWLTSAWLHGLVLAAVVFGMQHWEGFGRRGEADRDSRLTGLLTQLDGSESETDAPPGEISVSAAESELALSTSDLPTSDDPPSEDLAPVDLDTLLGAAPSGVEGPSVGVPKFSSPATPPAGGGLSDGPAPPGGLARGAGDGGFFGIPAAGETFAYVIDVSGSMTDDDAIKIAKAELMASLGGLRGGQRFQIIFYNERPTPLRLPGRAPEKLYDATDVNKMLARQEIAAVRADLGTKHMPALRAALDIEPDVIFFLTDADEPALTARDLAEIRKANTRGTRIHAVEFGKGAKLDGSRSLERLAGENHGAYQYRDVTRLGRREEG